MSKIRPIASNFLKDTSEISFENMQFQYGPKKPLDSLSAYNILTLKQIKTLTYKKPDKAAKGVGHGFLGAPVNIYRAIKSIKSGKKIEFNVHFKDGKHLAGVMNMDDYFVLQNAWLDVR